MLDAVLRRGLPLDTAMPSATAALDRHEDKRLAVAIAGEALRRLPDLDALIDSATARPLPADAKARMVLRIALVQAMILGTPQHAAIATALPLLAGGPRRLAHGVFGTLMRQEAALPEVPTLPEAVAERWRSQWGERTVEAAARAISVPPPLDLTLIDPTETARWAEELGGHSLMPGHVRLDRAEVTGLPGFAEGRWWVQDIASSLPARLFGAGEGRAALDLAAAPGGKTLQLAAQGWRTTAVDRAKSRLARLSENLARTGLAAQLVEADLMDWEPPEPASAVLLDAPCSATGTFRRHPEVLYRASPRAVAEAARAQAAMLGRAARWVKPGGLLVYSVCSLEREEGEDVVRSFLDAHPEFAAEPLGTGESPHGWSSDDNGLLRILPGAIPDPGGADGFFAARLRRSA